MFIESQPGWRSQHLELRTWNIPHFESSNEIEVQVAKYPKGTRWSDEIEFRGLELIYFHDYRLLHA